MGQTTSSTNNNNYDYSRKLTTQTGSGTLVFRDDKWYKAKAEQGGSTIAPKAKTDVNVGEKGAENGE